jgi:hypothetical protein
MQALPIEHGKAEKARPAFSLALGRAIFAAKPDQCRAAAGALGADPDKIKAAAAIGNFQVTAADGHCSHMAMTPRTQRRGSLTFATVRFSRQQPLRNRATVGALSLKG